MEDFNVEKHSHMRLNQLTNEWVIVSPNRTQRPWLGEIAASEDEKIKRFDETNPLCPGVKRSSDKVTDIYTSTYTFDNDFPSLLEIVPGVIENDDDLLLCKKAEGKCLVTCFHPFSDLTLPLMQSFEIENVIKEWITQFQQLEKKYEWIQIFENKGKMMGCSNSHPHSQIYACSFLPTEALKEDLQQLEYYKKKGNSLLLDYAKLEIKKNERIIAENDHWLVVVPYWATWPFELLVLPKQAVRRINELNALQQKDLASIMKSYLTKYDNLFKTSFPYTMGWHGAPTGRSSDGCEYAHWQLHAHYCPPLLRSSTIKKHIAGFELLAGAARDITPEKASKLLRSCSSKHYKVVAEE